ncbi:MAG: M23 family metallopeptidase [Alphaproteobacteria bacterium]
MTVSQEPKRDRRKLVVVAIGIIIAGASALSFATRDNHEATVGTTLTLPEAADGTTVAARSADDRQSIPPTEPRLRRAALDAMAARSATVAAQSDDRAMPANSGPDDHHSAASSDDDPTAIEPSAGFAVRTLAVRAGDTIGRLLAEAGVPSDIATSAIQALREVWDPRELKPRQAVTLTFAAASGAPDMRNLHGIKLQAGIDRDVIVSRTAEGFVAREEERALTRALTRAAGSIEDSLYASAVKAGVPPPVLVEMIRAFSYDVDFQRDIHSGDRFEVMFESVYQEDGTAIAFGPPLYAAVSTGGDLLQLYRYTPKSGTTDYFNGKGEGVKKALLKTPVDGARLTSSFGPRRHPVLGYTRMHRGVDFGAAAGTPIYAAGDGVIAHAGPKGHYGNYVEIRHTSEYSTAYGHLSRFANGLRSRARVRQGQIIGYVGSTGLSTGPHLHYEVHRNNEQVNPVNVKFPAGEKLIGPELNRFQIARANFEHQFARVATETKIAQQLKD